MNFNVKEIFYCLFVCLMLDQNAWTFFVLYWNVYPLPLYSDSSFHHFWVLDEILLKGNFM